MSSVTPIAGNGLSNAFNELNQYVISNIEVIKGGNSGNSDSTFVNEHIKD